MLLLPPDWQLLSLAVLVSIATAFTPGPNNTICMMVAANFGFRGALPFALGVTIGFPLLLVAVGAGLGGLLAHQPQLHALIKICGALLLLHMAWRIARARGRKFGGKKTAPGFLQAIVFQWVNPKAITHAFSVVAAFARPGEALVSDVFYLALISMLVALASTITWAGFGTAISRWLKTARAQAIFNGIMGALLALSAVAIMWL